MLIAGGNVTHECRGSMRSWLRYVAQHRRHRVSALDRLHPCQEFGFARFSLLQPLPEQRMSREDRDLGRVATIEPAAVRIPCIQFRSEPVRNPVQEPGGKRGDLMCAAHALFERGLHHGLDLLAAAPCTRLHEQFERTLLRGEVARH